MKLFKDSFGARSAFSTIKLSLDRRWMFGRDNSYGETPLYHVGWLKNSNSSAIQLESAAMQLLLASAERHMLQKKEKTFASKLSVVFFLFEAHG